MAAVSKIARRRLIALTVAYAVALQTVLTGFVVLAMAAAPEICAPAGIGPMPGSNPSGPDCAACPVSCGGGPDGLAPDTLAVTAPPALFFGIGQPVAPAVLGAAQCGLPPCRAPPAA
jgi:hypothetical protein